MSKIEANVLISTDEYKHGCDEDLCQKSLSEILFEEASVRKAKNNEVVFVNARNSSELRTLCELEQASKQFAANLEQFGFKKGDVLQLIIHNHVDYYVPVLGAWYLGGVASVVNPNSRVETLAEQMVEMGTKFVVCFPENLEQIVQAIKLNNSATKTNVVVFEQIDPNFEFREENCHLYRVVKYGNFLEASPKQFAAKFSPDDVVVIFWSSGTTGKPKGAIYTFSLMARMLKFEPIVFNEENLEVDTFLMTTNFFHAGGFTFSLVNGLRNSKKVVLFSAKEANSEVTTDDLFQACHQFRPQTLKIGSHHAIRLGYSKPRVETLDLSSVFYVLPMGAPVHEALTEELRSVFPRFKALLISYGSTETFLISHTQNPNELGRLYQGVSVRIVDHVNSTKDNLILLGPNQIGEIEVKTPYLMKSYLDPAVPFWSDGEFAKSGDLGHYLPDGTLMFNGRLKELIKYCGNHLYPKELEDVIQTHPGVAEVAIFGMPHPRHQELVTALVVKRKDATIDADDITRHIEASGVEDYKFVRGGVKFVDTIPKNATGKILRMNLPQFFNDN